MGGKNISESFSYNFSELETMNKAKMIATRNSQSFSKLVVEAIKSYIKEQDEEKKSEAQVSCLSIPIRKEKDLTNYTQQTLLNFMKSDPQELEHFDDHNLEKFRSHCVTMSITCATIKKKRKYHR